jgi:putative ABC transport system substrate-binding protein
MRRREFLGAVLGTSVGWLAPAHAQQPNRTYRIGVLSTSRRTADINAAFIDGLNKLGFVEGQNLSILEVGFGKSRDEFADAARELVEAKVDAIVAMSGSIAIRAAQAATQSIPIIGIADDMVLEGHVRSIANHGGNTTGLSLLAAQLDGKRQEILIELLPNARRMAIMFDTDVQMAGQMDELHGAAHSRNVELLDYPVHRPAEIAPALEAAKMAGAEAVNFMASPLFSVAYRKANFAKALALGLPATHHWPEGAADGAFVAYGPRQIAVFRQLATPVAKVLRGEDPETLPVEQPTKIELAINMKVAQQLGIAVSPSFLLRADEVIE